jgi:hypothetical protein
MSGQIDIIDFKGIRYTLDVDENDIIESIKEKLSDILNIPAYNQRILYRAKELGDNETLGNHMKINKNNKNCLNVVEKL